MIYVVAFDPIKILTCWVLQNDRQNLSFVKSSNVVSKKMAGNTCKMAKPILCAFRFETEFSMNSNCKHATISHRELKLDGAIDDFAEPL